jgi:AraC-like DNA-binding protein
MPSSTIAARMVLRILDHCRSRGVDADALCRELALNPAALAEPGARIPYETIALVGERALALTGDEAFGLHLAGDVGRREQLDAGLLLAMASPTVLIALQNVARYQRFWGDGDRTKLVRLRDGVLIRYALPGARGAYARHADECAMAEIAIGVRALSGRDLAPRAVRFRHAPPRALDEHHQLFRCPVEFCAAHTEMELDESACSTPMAHANATFSSIFEQEVSRAIARLPAAARASENVRATVRAALASGGATLAATARLLRVSPRTLQRQLQAERTSFADVVDALRRELAGAYLDRGLSIPDVAALLGYSDETAFHHAYRRWTGSTPGRHAARGGTD